jgi:hypothetical protein
MSKQNLNQSQMGQAMSVLQMNRDILSGYEINEIENFSYDLIEILKWNIEESAKDKDLPELTEVTASATHADKEEKKLDLDA